MERPYVDWTTRQIRSGVKEAMKALEAGQGNGSGHELAIRAMESELELRDSAYITLDYVRSGHLPYFMLMDMFCDFRMAREFEKAWQFGVFKSWIKRPTHKGLLRLVEVVRLGMD